MKASLLVGAVGVACAPLLLSLGCTEVIQQVPGPVIQQDGGPTVDDDSGALQPTDDGGTGDGSGDSGPKPKDAGKDTNPPPGYPAPHPPIPTEDNQGGALLIAPKITTVTYSTDDSNLRTRLELFGDTITSTPWWTAVTEGYCKTGGAPCIGPGTGNGHVVIPGSAPANISDDQIKTLIQGMVSAGKLPAPSADTLYALYFPQGTKVDLMGATSCQQFGAYHNEVSVTPPGGAAVTVAYAVMPRCGGEQMTTLGASHEFIEAATDAHPFTSGGYRMSDQAWGFIGDEVGDVCVDVTGGNSDSYLEGTFTVQRSWSNTSAAKSHDPCVPAPAGPYFNSAPEKQQIAVGVGKTVTVTVTGFSDNATAPWSISTKELTRYVGGQDVLTLSLDKSSLSNGGTATLSITLNSSPAQGAAVFAIVSQSGGKAHLWPALVVPQ